MTFEKDFHPLQNHLNKKTLRKTQHLSEVVRSAEERRRSRVENRDLAPAYLSCFILLNIPNYRFYILNTVERERDGLFATG